MSNIANWIYIKGCDLYDCITQELTLKFPNIDFRAAVILYWNEDVGKLVHALSENILS